MPNHRPPPNLWALLLGLSAATLASPALAGGWEVVNREDGITVSRKAVAGSPLVAFKGEGVVDAPMEKILHVLVDNDHRTEWVDRLYISERLEQKGSHDFVVYQAFKLPVVMSNRDYVYRGRAVLKPDGKVVLELGSVKHRAAPKTVGVRAHLINSRYVLAPTAGGTKTKVRVEIHTDPKGLLPSWIVNLIQKSWPVKTLNGIRRQVKKPHVKTYPLPPAG